MIDLNTNILKLRDDRFAVMVVPVSGACDAGDFIHPHADASVVGIALSDAEEGDEIAVCVQAERVVVPCDFSGTLEAGTPVAFESGEDRVTEVVNGDLICGILVDQATATDDECVIKLVAPVFPQYVIIT